MILIDIFYFQLQAIFMIPTKPPPSFRNPDKWSPEFIDFVTKCLVKNPEHRTLAKDLLQVIIFHMITKKIRRKIYEADSLFAL